MGQSNFYQLFSNPKFKSEFEKAFALVQKVLPSYYQYIFRQTQLTLRFLEANKGRDKKELAEDSSGLQDLRNWSRLSDTEKGIYTQSLDIVPLLALERLAVDEITQDYLRRVKQYLESPQYAQFSTTAEYKRWLTERTTWNNFFEGRRVSNKLEDFLQKLQQMNKSTP